MSRHGAHLNLKHFQGKPNYTKPPTPNSHGKLKVEVTTCDVRALMSADPAEEDFPWRIVHVDVVPEPAVGAHADVGVAAVVALV